MGITELSLSEAAELISQEQLSPVELTQAHLERIESLEPRLNCFITFMPDAALECARAAEEEILNGDYQGPLHGIPIALKDLFETKGLLTTAGSLFFKESIPEEDSEVVKRLKAEGVVILGKLNMHEIALGVTNNNPHYGACHNPWKIDLTPGGSSGGSGAALAAGMCMGSLGSDTGGSIRIPAALCGIVGLKPTYGRVSLRGVVPLSWNLDHPGPMARRVRDIALLMQVIAGYDPQDPASVEITVPDYSAQLSGGVRGWRICVAEDKFFTRAEAEVLDARRVAAEVFVSLGAQVDHVEFPHGYEAAKTNGLMTTSDAAAFHHERLENHPEQFGADVRQRLLAGAAFTSSQYIRARHTQSLLRRELEQFFSKYDILLTPTTPITAPLLEGPDAVEEAATLTRFTAPFNLTGLPALSLPCGFSSSGLPIGLQLVTRPWGEAALLRAAFAYEQATTWHLRQPAL